MIRSLEYRAPRAIAQFDVDFVSASEHLPGICVDLSEKGMRAQFVRIPPLGQVGEIVFRHPLGNAAISARIIYLFHGQVGLTFLEQTAQDREGLRRLIGA